MRCSFPGILDAQAVHWIIIVLIINLDVKDLLEKGLGQEVIARNIMRSSTKYLIINTPKRYDFKNITQDVGEVVQSSGVKEGLCLVNSMHITASVFINDAESGLLADFGEWLEDLAPYDPKRYKHNLTGEDNGDAHLKRQVMGREVVVAVTNGRLDLGTWEQIYYGEFDGQRNKRVLVKVIGE